jgi:microcystin-dependent protein
MEYHTFKSTGKPTVGDTKLSLVGSDHMGWLICDGRTLNVKDFYYLYQVIGTTYGTTASTTFKLPDPAGRVLGVIGSGVGLTTRAAGSNVGAETHTLSIAEMPTHNHPGSSNNTAVTGITDSGHAHSYTAAGGDSTDRVQTGLVGDTTTGAFGATTGSSSANIVDPSHTHTLVMSNQGGSNPHNNMQPTLFVGNMFIYCGKPSVGSYPFTGNGIY